MVINTFLMLFRMIVLTILMRKIAQNTKKPSIVKLINLTARERIIDASLIDGSATDKSSVRTGMTKILDFVIKRSEFWTNLEYVRICTGKYHFLYSVLIRIESFKRNI